MESLLPFHPQTVRSLSRHPANELGVPDPYIVSSLLSAAIPLRSAISTSETPSSQHSTRPTVLQYKPGQPSRADQTNTSCKRVLEDSRATRENLRTLHLGLTDDALMLYMAADALPSDIWIVILQYLTVEDLAHLCQISRYFHSLVCVIAPCITTVSSSLHHLHAHLVA